MVFMIIIFIIIVFYTFDKNDFLIFLNRSNACLYPWAFVFVHSRFFSLISKWEFLKINKERILYFSEQLRNDKIITFFRENRNGVWRLGTKFAVISRFWFVAGTDYWKNCQVSLKNAENCQFRTEIHEFSLKKALKKDIL